MDVDPLPLCHCCIDGIEDLDHHCGSRNIPIADGQPLVCGGTRSLRDFSQEEGKVGYALLGFGQIYKRGHLDGQEPPHTLVHRLFGCIHANRVCSGQQLAGLHPVGLRG